uniref:Conserved oligomeric Golgi complex subunit 4 n=1 Tax=Echinostoma caproni TaxID=27848 RepID=A0A183BBG1_9TREM
LFGIISLIQTECDTLVRRVLDRFRAQHRLSELFRLIQPSVGSGGKLAHPGLLSNMVGTGGSAGNTAGVVGTVSSAEQVQLERVLTLEPILSEIVLLNTRIDLYMRFMRRHVTSDLNSAELSADELEGE